MEYHTKVFIGNTSLRASADILCDQVNNYLTEEAAQGYEHINITGIPSSSEGDVSVLIVTAKERRQRGRLASPVVLNR